MQSFLALFGDYTFQVVALGSALLGLISGVLGTYAVLRRQSLLGDGVSHAALPGVVLAFLLTGVKETSALLLGAIITGLLAAFVILSIVRHSRIKFDGALALVMSVFFGLGTVLLTYVQRQPNASQAGLNRFIFGQASTLLKSDVWFMLGCAVILVAIVLLCWKEFKVFSFDPTFAQSIGLPVGKLNVLLTLLLVVGIIVGLQSVGVVLMSAMLIAPAVAARQWTKRLSTMMILSAVFGAVSGVLGTAMSSLMTGMPTGPAIVLFVSLFACVSLLFAPGRGILGRLIQQRRNRKAFALERGKQHVPTA